MITRSSDLPFVFFAAVPYDYCLSGRTRRLAEALIARGHDVTFVELPLVRTTARRALRPSWRRSPGDGVRVISLRPLPGYLRLSSSRVGAEWVRYAANRLRQQLPHLGQAVVMASTPWWVPVLRELPGRLRFYDCIDHVNVHTPRRHGSLFRRWDEELLGLCDASFVVSEALRGEVAGRIGTDRVVLIPNGVKESWIEAAVRGVPRELLTGSRERPVAGFLGALFEWVDLELLAETAARLPDVAFAIVGPRRRGIRLNGLKGRANVRCFPAQPYDQVARWIQSFDVCLIAFKHAISALCADPVKLYEYLALGKPVVSTLRFGKPGAPIFVAQDAPGFAARIREALADSESRRAERIEYARSHTWERRAADIVAAACRLLDGSTAALPGLGGHEDSCPIS